ncbi:MAG: translation initiation factor IF-2 [Pseudanabaenaceae cyanobacterium SKYGB_i_bin29]|nr:translation initiation factor IF-2 [Pseudanabaenaceae cyanobacterium SKYG29]MDW8420648.1 translation initiation factor IF-2 [Pseudanabaenaceae cyanobacterium SKYGB_i_bin29]
MSRVRIYDLARELHLDNKDVMAICEEHGIPLKSHSSTITEEEAEKVRASARAGNRPLRSSAKPSRTKETKEKEVSPKTNKIVTVSKPEVKLVAPPTKPAAPAPLPKPEPPVPPTKPSVPKAEPVAPPPKAEEKPTAPPGAVAPPKKPEPPAKKPEEVTTPPPKKPEPPTLRKPVPKPTLPKKEATSPPPKPKPPVISAKRPTPPKGDLLIERGISPPKPVKPAAEAPAPPVKPTRPVEPEIPPLEPVATFEEVALRPRPTKKQKSKVEDLEALEQEKVKRSNKLRRFYEEEDIDFDEEDWFDDYEEEEEAPISLSLVRPSVRPPKPSVSKPTGGMSRGDAQKSPKKPKERRPTTSPTPEKPTSIELADAIPLPELASRLVVAETEIIRILFLKGIMVNINQALDLDTAKIVCQELGVEVREPAASAAATKTEMLEMEDLENLQRRPPVVTIMGHVDHGKTSLLDAIRKTKVAQGEAGGITQHIGAYHVEIEVEGKPQTIVFLDTPGHEAFTAMRARGAKVTDIAVLVVAADDGVQPQTIEAISHARAAKVPIIVAINKIDKPEAQPDRIRQELTEYGLIDEAWGGDTIMVPVSALRGDNLDTLLEMILLVAEVEDLSANPDRPAKGTIIEAHMDKARGPVATFLVQNGTLKVGDIVLAGSVYGKVRAMINDRGERVEKALPSFPVEVLGLNELPQAGDEFEVFTDEKQARALAEERAEAQRQSRLQQSLASRRISLGTVSAQAQEGELKELNVIVKADVQGSVEAIVNSLSQLPQQEVQLRVLLAAVGEVSENDVALAAASNAVILGFNTSLAPGARQAADELGVDIRDYNIIYNLLEDVQAAMEGLLEPELVEEPLGQAEVRQVFHLSKAVVAGCYVLSGKLVRNCNLRVLRKGKVIHEGALDSLRRMKDDVKEVASGFECGVSVNKYTDWQEGDIIEAFRMVTKRRTLST